MKVNDPPYVLAFGDSLTAGYGLPADASFAARLQLRLRSSFPGVVVQNAGVSGDTTEDGLRRIPALLTSLSRKPDLTIVELGANDLLRGVLPERTRVNLDSILRLLGQCGILTLLATFEAPRFLGPAAAKYDGIYSQLAAKHGVASAAFFPVGVLGHPELVLADGLHPNARAIELVVDALLPTVTAVLDQRRHEAA